MLWYWLFKSVLWTAELPFHALPAGEDFMPIPALLLSAVETLGGYTKWFLYLLGDTAGDAFVLVFTWTIPLILAAYLWRMIKSALFGSVNTIRGISSK